MYGQATKQTRNTYLKHGAKAPILNSNDSTQETVTTDNVNLNTLTATQQAQSHDKSDSDSKAHQSYISRLVAPETLPNTILCVIGIAGVIAAVLTLVSIKKQTKATQQNVLLQETAMKQWLVFQNWTHERRQANDGSRFIHIRFEIVNPTNWPLTLGATMLQIRRRETMVNHFVELCPNVPYSMGISNIDVDDEQYLSSGTAYVLFGAITYLDCFDKLNNQIFSGMVHCTKDMQTSFRMEYFPDHPYQQKQTKGNDKAN
jgi:hypothetical protein